VVEIGGQEFHLFASKGGKFTNRHRWASEEGSVETGFTWHTEARLTLIRLHRAGAGRRWRGHHACLSCG
jgi:hypothetical protein